MVSQSHRQTDAESQLDRPSQVKSRGIPNGPAEDNSRGIPTGPAAGRGVSKRNDETMMYRRSARTTTRRLAVTMARDEGGGSTASDDECMAARKPGRASWKARGEIRQWRSPSREQPADVDFGRMDSCGENRANRAGNDAGVAWEGKEAPSEGAG